MRALRLPLTILATATALAFLVPEARAINARYAQQLERSGCTQVTESQGCDITKSKAENAKAGFVTGAPAPAPVAPAPGPTPAASPYAGQWVAKDDSGKTLATIRVDAKDRVWVNGQRVNARRADGGLLFRSGRLLFMIQGDRRLKGEDTWSDTRSGAKGLIHPD